MYVYVTYFIAKDLQQTTDDEIEPLRVTDNYIATRVREEDVL